MNRKKELYLEIQQHLLLDEAPSRYLNEIWDEPIFCDFPFNMIQEMRSTPQSPKFHPEGSVWNHTMLVVDEAAKVKHKSKNATAFLWAALLHDIGKPITTKNRNGKITSYDHDKVGEKLATDFLRAFTEDDEFISVVATLVRWHMQILFVVNGLPFADIAAMKQQTDVNEVALLGLCDRFGRLHCDRQKEAENVHLFLKKCGEATG